MTWRTFFVLALLVTPLLACQAVTGPLGGAPTPAAGTTSPAGAKPPAKTSTPPKAASRAKDYQYIFGAPTHPLQVTATLDLAHQVTGTVSLNKGAQLQTTGADGTLYTLEIPRAAVTSDTIITLTPASKLSGLPFDGKPTYAVEVGPEGLSLYADGFLTITPTKPIALAQQLFFGYQAGGKTVGLAMPVADSNALQIRLLHFSGYGVAEGTAADAAVIQQQLGGDVEAALQSLAAEVLRQMRDDQLNGTTTDESLAQQIQTLSDLYDQWGEQVVKPAIQAAGTSCAASKNAIAKLVSWERDRQLMGLGSKTDTTFSQLLDLIRNGSKLCVKEEYQRCVDNHVINGMIPIWLGLERQAQLLGLEGEGQPVPEEVQLARDLTAKCLTFELQFHSQGSFDTGDGGYQSTVDGKIRLQFDPATYTISGSGPLDNLSFEFKMPKGGKGMKCTADTKTGGATFEVKGLAYVQDTRSETDPEPYVRDFNLLYFPGVTSESYKIHCILTDSQGHVSTQDYASPPSGYWSGIFFVLHQEELNGGGAAATGGPLVMPVLDLNALQLGAMPAMPAPAMPAEGGFFADQWDITSGDAQLASKEWVRDNPSVRLTEAGTLKLIHKPGG